MQYLLKKKNDFDNKKNINARIRYEPQRGMVPSDMCASQRQNLSVNLSNLISCSARMNYASLAIQKCA